MRPDMAKVVTESPRHVGMAPARALKHGGRLPRADVEAAREDAADGLALPQQSATHLQRGRPSESKTFSDVLGPLKGYLRKQVGRPWDTVFSEMSRSLDSRTMSGRHIWTHVFQEVEVHTYLGHDGKTVYPRPRFRWLDEHHVQPVRGLYVHPRTGLLCYKPWSWRRRPAPQPVTEIVLDPFHKLERLGGLWFLCSYTASDEYVPPRKVHVGTHHEREIAPGHWVTNYTRAKKKQLSKRELRTHGLSNEP